jgi:drug/metabolite transporter (DMT)-like permease
MSKLTGGAAMPLFYLSISLAVISSALYHIFQRAIAPGANPVLSLLTTYCTALVLTAALLIVFPLADGFWASLAKLNWASIALALAIVGLEIGYLLAYRAGWNISTAAIAGNAAAGLLLLPSGILLFRERPSWINLAGVLVCILGLIMINVRR